MLRTGHREVQDTEPAGTVASNGQERRCPTVLEAPAELRLAFFCKVYAILSFQLLLTAAAIAATVPRFRLISHYVLHTTAGFSAYLVSFFLPTIFLCLLFAYNKRHPVNFVLLGLFTVSSASMVGLCCAHPKGRIVLEAVVLTSLVAVNLPLHTFWLVKGGRDFSLLGPFCFISLKLLIVFGLIQVFYPPGKLATTIYGCLGSIMFSGYIIYDTNNLIKQRDYDAYIWASVSLYLKHFFFFAVLFAC